MPGVMLRQRVRSRRWAGLAGLRSMGVGRGCFATVLEPDIRGLFRVCPT